MPGMVGLPAIKVGIRSRWHVARENGALGQHFLTGKDAAVAKIFEFNGVADFVRANDASDRRHVCQRYPVNSCVMSPPSKYSSAPTLTGR